CRVFQGPVARALRSLPHRGAAVHDGEWGVRGDAYDGRYDQPGLSTWVTVSGGSRAIHGRSHGDVHRVARLRRPGGCPPRTSGASRVAQARSSYGVETRANPLTAAARDAGDEPATGLR